MKKKAHDFFSWANIIEYQRLNPILQVVVQDDFSIFSVLFLDFYDFGCLFLFLIDKVGVYLCGADILVGEHLADGVDVGSSGYEKCGVGVAAHVEGDVFVDSG